MTWRVSTTPSRARPAAGAHPLEAVKQELQAQGACEDVALDFLPESAVDASLAGRFPGPPVGAGFTRPVRRQDRGGGAATIHTTVYGAAASLPMRQRYERDTTTIAREGIAWMGDVSLVAPQSSA